jgi:transposase
LDWLQEGHLAYFILDVVETLDLSEIEDRIHQKDPRGNRPYSPSMMVALLIYAYCVGVYSSRKIERATYEDVAFRVLAGGEHPFFTSINEFRRIHLKSFRALFVQVLHLCQKAGLVKLGQVAVDGTKVAANASKHKAMSYDRMNKLAQLLEGEVEALLQRAIEVDQEEDAKLGDGMREEDLPKELRRRQDRLARLREAKAALEKEARQARSEALREQAQKARERASRAETQGVEGLNTKLAERSEAQAEMLHRQDHDEEDPPAPKVTTDGLPLHRVRTQADGTPHPKAQRNFVDPDSRIMETGGTFVQGYNCQLAVDEAHQIILAQAVTNQSPDNGNLVPIVEQVLAFCEALPEHVTADAGYWTPQAPEICADLGTEALISTKRRGHWEKDEPIAEGAAPEDADARESMRWKLRTAQGRALYARRKATVEPVNGQIKEARGFRRFSLRGLDKVQREWDLVTTAHNLLKLFRFGALAAA